MSKKSKLSDKTTRVLLALRKGVRGWPYKVRRILSDIPRQTVEYNIKKLETENIVKGYTPIVQPEVFGEPFLVRIPVNPTEYQFEKDAEHKIQALSSFFKEAVEHAPVAFFIYRNESRIWLVNCITVTKNIDGLANRLSTELNIAREDISLTKLEGLEGIPNYGKHSLPQKGQEIQ